MGIAQKEQLDLMLHDFLLEILQVNVIAVVCSQIQIIADNDSSVILDHLGKRIVHRLLNEHTVSRFRKGFYRHGKCKYHARRFDQPVRLHIPVMASDASSLQSRGNNPPGIHCIQKSHASLVRSAHPPHRKLSENPYLPPKKAAHPPACLFLRQNHILNSRFLSAR